MKYIVDEDRLHKTIRKYITMRVGGKMIVEDYDENILLFFDDKEQRLLFEVDKGGNNLGIDIKLYDSVCDLFHIVDYREAQKIFVDWFNRAQDIIELDPDKTIVWYIEYD